MYTRQNTLPQVYQEMAKTQITCKKGVLTIVQDKIRTYTIAANSSQSDRESKYYILVVSAFERFRDAVDSAVLFDQLEDWWFYNCRFTVNEFQMILCHVSSFEVEEVDTFLDGSKAEKKKRFNVKYDAEYPIVNVVFPKLTVEEYAHTVGVTSELVRRWIRRGKLRTAYRNGSEWVISYLTHVPERGHYEPVTYSWNSPMVYNPLSLPDGIPILTNIHSVSIARATTRDDKYDVRYEYDDGRVKADTLDSTQREKLELFLLSKEYVTPDTRHF